MKTVLTVLGIFILIVVIIVGLGKPVVTAMDTFSLSDPVDFPMQTGSMWVTNFWIKNDHNILTINEFPDLENINVYSDSVMTVQLEGGQEFPLGFPQQDKADTLLFHLVPDKGDQIQIRYQHSKLSWLTPLDINIMMSTPDARRNVYYTLTWIKANGNTLTVKWKYQQWKYSGRNWGGWRSRSEADDSGLIDIAISNSGYK